MYTSPGLYRHYKGGLYRVLFVAKDARPEGLAKDAPLSVYVAKNGGVFVGAQADVDLAIAGGSPESLACKLFDAEDSTDEPKDGDDSFVVYVSMSHGVRLRMLSEFNRPANEGKIMDLPRSGDIITRFDRVGE